VAIDLTARGAVRKGLYMQAGPPRRVTLADVGRQAGVSPGTVSRAINGRGHVAIATRERVLVVADRLGFTPNALAQALLNGRSFTVGLLTSGTIGSRSRGCLGWRTP
jgi:LacI family transcriptional regulator